MWPGSDDNGCVWRGSDGGVTARGVASGVS